MGWGFEVVAAGTGSTGSNSGTGVRTRRQQWGALRQKPWNSAGPLPSQPLHQAHLFLSCSTCDNHLNSSHKRALLQTAVSLVLSGQAWCCRARQVRAERGFSAQGRQNIEDLEGRTSQTVPSSPHSATSCPCPISEPRPCGRSRLVLLSP